MKSENIKFWDSVQKTNPAFTKDASFGRKMTAIDAYSQIKEATVQWGMYGAVWGLKNISTEYLNLANEQIMCVMTCYFYYPSGEFEIGSTIMVQTCKVTKDGKFFKYDDDFRKKIETDIITKALSRLGFNADVFLGMFDDSKYVNSLKEEERQRKALEIKEALQANVDKWIESLLNCGNVNDLTELFKSMPRAMQKNPDIISKCKELKEFLTEETK